MSLTNICSALITAYTSMGLNVDTAYPNVTFEPSDSSLEWIRLSFLPGQPTVESLGNGGQDRIEGIFQIDVFTPIGTGWYTAHQYIEQFRQVFVGGKMFTYSGQYVLIKSCGANPPIEDGKWFQNTIEIQWESQITRTII